MIEFIVGATAGIYVYKRYTFVRNLIDVQISEKAQKAKDIYFGLRYKIVGYGNDKYAIRQWEFGYEFLDSREYPTNTIWWSDLVYVEKYCITDLENCKRMYKHMKEDRINKRYGKPI